MEFRILGPLEVLVDGERLPPLGPKQRALLAMLLVHGNEVVSSDRLIDALWPNESESAAAALQASVSRLRKALGTRKAFTSAASVAEHQEMDASFHRVIMRMV